MSKASVRGRTEITEFRDDENLRFSNHVIPRVKPTRIWIKQHFVLADNDRDGY